ncbi:MAG: Ig-like domain repeat protein [Acidobacteriaceae bacterium]|jgi:sugar lactone lactonase YvrE
MPSSLVAALPVLLTPAFRFTSPVSLGSTAEAGTVTVMVSGAGTLNTISVLTQGIPNQDFTFGAGGSCTTGMTYFAGQICTVAVNFQPLHPGLRQGAVVLLAGDGSVLGSELLCATGVGATVVMVPAPTNLVAGNGQWIYNGDGIWAQWASLFLPMGGAADAAGNLFISDSNNHRIRRVDGNTQIISTVAGDGTPGFGGDGGPATSAMLDVPADVKLDGAGNLYIADSANHAVRMVNAATGIIQTIAGIGGQAGYSGDGGPATQALLSNPDGIAFDGDHTLYISDTGNNVIRKVNLTTGIITTVAGTGTAGFSGDGGPATSGQLNNPWGIALGSDGSLYIADLSNNRIRKVSPSGTLSTLAGNGGNGFAGDNGPATAALLNVPAGVAVDVAGNVFIADSGNSLVREVDANTGVISTHSGNQTGLSDGGGAIVGVTPYEGPYALFFDGWGNLYVSDMFHQTIREVPAESVLLIYPPMQEGGVSSPMPAIIENAGNADLDFSALQTVSYSALDPATTTCQVSQPLPIGASCTLGVESAPTTTGNYLVGTLTVESNAQNSPSSVTLKTDVLAVAPTVVSLTTSLNPASVGAMVTFTASVATSGSTTPTGSVNFMDGTVDLGTTALSGTAVATFSTTALATGSHSVTAVYSGDDQNATATSSVLIEVVKQPTTTSLTASPNPSALATSVTLTATVAGPSGTAVVPGGTVTFLDGSTTIGAGALNSSGIATYSTASLSAGQHNVTASYGGDALDLASQSAVLIQTVTKAGTATTLTTSNATVYAGVSVTFTSAVSRTDGVIPTGIVTFFDGAVAIGAGTLNGLGTATLTTTDLAGGVHSISAVYGGDASDLTSTSPSVNETVQPIATAATIAVSANPSVAGAPLQLTATVTQTGTNGNGGTFSGTVTFTDGATVLGTATVSSTGVATLSISTLAVGAHTIGASYGGNANYVGSTSTTIAETIQSAATATALASSLSPSVAGMPVTLTAVVAGNGGIPTGTVTFLDGTGAGAVTLGTGTLNGQGIAKLITSALAVGQHSIVAIFSGDAKDSSSTSAVLMQTVQIAATTTTIASSLNPSSFAAGVTFTASVATTGNTVSGTVTFSDGQTVLGVAPISAGSAIFSTSTLALGAHSIIASYSGDANNAPSQSGPLNERVLQAAGVSITSSVNPSLAQAPLILTASINAPQGVAVSGTVTFMDGNVALGTGAVSPVGAASLTISTLAVGQHSIVAVYSGDANNQAATSDILVETIQIIATNATLISSLNPSLSNAPLTLTSTVVGKGGNVTGTVTFEDGTTVLGAANLNAAGVATFTVSGLSPGLHSIIAIYGGDANNSQCTSPVLLQNVVQTTTVSLSSSQNPSLALASVSFTAVVSNGSMKSPSGVVEFSDGTAQLGTVALTATGTATFTAASLSTGQHTVSATYSGDSLNLPGTAPVLTQSVQLRPTTNTLTASSTSLTGGQQVTLISVVEYSGPVTPTGTVSFTNNGTVLGTGTVDKTGVATITVNLLTNSPTVIATYSGDSVYAASTSAQTSVTVPQPTQFTMTLNPAAVTLQSQQNSTTTLTITSLNNFADTLDLGCLGLPFAATCTFTKDQVALSAGGVQVVQVVVDTGSPLTAGSQARLERHSAGSLAAMCFLPGSVLFGLFFGRSRRRLAGLLMVLLLAGFAAGLEGCSGLHINGTPPGAYVFQVTATGTVSGVTQSTDVTLTVTQ